MLVFKYSLMKKGKHLCPNCGKKTFVLYEETETKNIVGDSFGRCDREVNCGFHKKPETEKITFEIKKEVKEIKTNYISLKTLEFWYLKPEDCFLVDFLKTVFSDEQIKKAKQDYLLCSKNKATIFWQIDQIERVRSGKVMLYNPENGRRVKDAEGEAKIGWMHKKPFNLKQCLFGLYITKEDKNKTIAIVESEKTAVIMSVFVPDFIWLATGSKSGFKIEYLSPIKLRKIIAFPDKGCFSEWSEKANTMNGFGYQITVASIVEESECADGLDIADLYLKNAKK